jgi:transposase
MQAQETLIGVDVAKASLSSCTHGLAGRQDLSNDEVSIGSWLATLPSHAAIAVESTGRYHLKLVRMAHASGRRVFVLNARDVYFYAKALGARGKTDRTDAKVIARYLAEHQDSLRPWLPGTAAQERLQELLRCRTGVTTKRMSLRQVMRDVPGLDVAVGRLEQQFDELLQQIDAQVADVLAQDAQLSQGCAALVAYSGLDPRPNDSGARTGRRRISKRGSPELRRQLYMAAFAASHSKALGPLYLSIKAKGFKPTQALVILARKLLRIAWAVWKTRKPFDPSLLMPSMACIKT